MVEEWRETRYPGYQVSSLGRVQGPRKILQASLVKGYQQVCIAWKGFETRSGHRSKSVHTLVCESFHGPRPQGKVVRHRDGNPSNNQADNVCWGTNSENQRDRLLHGTSNIGSHTNARLTMDQARQIRAEHIAGSAQVELCRKYQIKQPAMSDLLKGKTYREHSN